MNIINWMETPRIYTAIAEWVACLCYVLILKKRVQKGKLVFLMAAFLCLLCLWQIFAGTLSIAMWFPGMVVAIAIMYLCIYVTCDVKMKDAVFISARVFILAEFMASMSWQVYHFMVINWGVENPWILKGYLVLSFTLVPLINYLLESKNRISDRALRVSTRETLSAVMVALGAFLMSNISFVYSNSILSASDYGVLYVRTLIDFGGLVMLYAQMDHRQNLEMKMEVEAMNAILKRHYEQYQMSQKNMEMLKREFHDLKHWIFAIRAEKDTDKKESYLDKMEGCIALKEAFTDTGNSVLDTLLTAKGIYCTQNHIQLMCLVDGKLVDFMDAMDICSIFGNALDNAIESVEKQTDYNKRLINVSLHAKNNFAIIEIENYSDKELVMEGDMPATTKKNKFYHGYGMKSIRMAAEKYGGSMTFHTENDWFGIRILLLKQ